MSQQSFFEPTTTHPGASRTAMPRKKGGEDARDASYRRVRANAEALTGKHERYLRLLKRAAKGTRKTQSGTVLRALTDMEAAETLGWGRSTVIGRRDELMARNDRAVTEVPLVEKAGRRECHVTGSTVTAWRAVPSLFD